MNIKIFFLLTIVYIMAINNSSSKAVYESKTSNSESDDEKIMRPHKRKVQAVSYVENEPIEQKGDRCSKVAKMSAQDESDNHMERFKGDNLQKRTLFDTNFPYGVVYGNGKPIGILKPYPQSFELAPIREVRVPTSERYARAADIFDEGETSVAKKLQKDSQYTNDKYPEILANFKIHNKVLKMQENRNVEAMNHKRDEALKHANTTSQATNKMVKKRNVAEESDTIEEIENSLKHIITQLGLAPNEKVSMNKRAVESAKADDAQEINEDEDLEAGSNKIDIHKESHENAGRTKKEGKSKNNKKKSNKAAVNEEANKEEDEEDEEDDEENIKRSSDKSKEQDNSDEPAVKQSNTKEQESDAVKRSSNVEPDLKRSAGLVAESSEDKIINKDESEIVNSKSANKEVEGSVNIKRSNLEEGHNAKPNPDSISIKRSSKEALDKLDAKKDIVEAGNMKRSTKDEKEFANNSKGNKKEQEVVSPKRSIGQNLKEADSLDLKKPPANYQVEGEAFLRNKRQNSVSTEGTDIVKGLETSGELTVSGNKNPLASSNEQSDYGKSKVTKKSTKDVESKPYDLELEKNIQKQIQAIKEQVKREIEALKSKQDVSLNSVEVKNRKKRAVQNTLIDEEKNFLNSKIDEDSIKPHRRSKRDFDTDLKNELNRCTSEKPLVDKRFAENKPNNEVEVGSDKIGNEEIKDSNKKIARESNFDEKKPFNSEDRETRHVKDVAKDMRQPLISENELVNSVVESDTLYKNLKSRSNDKAVNYKSNEEANDDTIQVDTNESKFAKSDGGSVSSNGASLKKRNTEDIVEIKDSNMNKKSPQHVTVVKRNENGAQKDNDVDSKDTNPSSKTKAKRMKSDEDPSSEANKECKSSTVKDVEVNENESDRKKRTESDDHNQEQQINLYDVALKKRELSSPLGRLANNKYGVKIENIAQLNSNDNRLRSNEDYDELGIRKRNTNENIETGNSKYIGGIRKLNEDESVRKRNIDLTEDTNVNAKETEVNDYPVKKRQSLSLYVPNDLKDDENVENTKQKRNEEVENNDKLTPEKRMRRNEVPLGKSLVKIEKSGITITDTIDRLKRNEDNSQESEVNKNKIAEPMGEISMEKDEKRKRRNEESEQMADMPNDLKTFRTKRNEIVNKEAKNDENLHPTKIELQYNGQKKEIKRTPLAILNRRDYVNEDDEALARNSRDLESRKRSKHVENNHEAQGQNIDSDNHDIKSRDSKLDEGKTRKRRRITTDEEEEAMRYKRNDSKEESKKSTKPHDSKKNEKSSNKSRRDLQKNRSSKKSIKQRDIRDQIRHATKLMKNINKRKSRSNNLDQAYLNPIVIHKRRKRSNMLYYPFREVDGDVDAEGDEFDDDNFEDRSSNFIRKREANNEQMEDELQDDNMDNKGTFQQENVNRITKRNSLLHDYVADMNSDAYENPNEYLYEQNRYNRKKRQDLEDDDNYLLNGVPDSRRSTKREINLGNSRDRKNNLKLDDSMLGLSDADLFGSLPQSYEGELSRFKRVKRNIDDQA